MMPALSPCLPLWFRRLNLFLSIVGVAFVVSYIVVGLVLDRQPFDYILLMRAAEGFCINSPIFSYGADLKIFYPGPFYTTFCLFYTYANPLLFVLWISIPLLLMLWIVGGRASVFAYPPLFLQLLLGQSSWLLLPAMILAARFEPGKRIPWWHGLVLSLCVFKPHIAALIVLYLLYQWWIHSRPAFWTGIFSMIFISLPSFFIRPGWPIEWLSASRGFDPGSLANIGFVPLQLLGLGNVPGAAATLLMLSFGGMVALLLYYLLKGDRKEITLYDAMLIFCFANPFIYDYDLIILLPFVASSRKRLLVALVAGVLGWVFALVSERYTMSFMVTLVLVIFRTYELRRTRSRLTWPHYSARMTV